MKRYLLFSGNNYYPSGGMDDFIGDFDTLQGAVDYIGGRKLLDDTRWAHVYDCDIREFAWQSEED